MREKIARGIAGLCALLLALGYFFLPVETSGNEVNNSGRKKVSLEAGETFSWAWTPSMDGADAIALHLSGTKKAQGAIVCAALTDESGAEAATARQAVSELDEDGGVWLRGSFQKGKNYTLTVWGEGEDTVKLKGAEDEETEEFYPMLTENASYHRQNTALLYFALGTLLAALTPVYGKTPVKKIANVSKKSALEKILPWATFVVIVVIGLLVAWKKPLFAPGEAWSSWDEEVHWELVRQMSITDAENAAGLFSTLSNGNPGYVPLAIGYNLGRIFTNDEQTLYHLAISCSTIFYALMAALAVKHAPRYKATFLAAGTLPIFLYLMTSISYDTVSIACILLGLSLTLETMAAEEKMSSFRAITLVSLLAFGTVAKLLYSPILFFLLLIPNEKFDSKKIAWAFRATVLLMFVWCVAAVYMAGDSVWSGDERFPDVSTPDQWAYMLGNPLEGFFRPLIYLWNDQYKYLVMGISDWAYTGNLGEISYLNKLYLWLLLIVSPLCTLGERFDQKSLMTPWRRIFLGGIALGCECLFVYALYLTSSPVGGTQVVGMQSRYFMPMWIALALALMWPQKIRERMGKAGEWMTLGVFLACSGINFWNAMTHLMNTGLW